MSIRQRCLNTSLTCRSIRHMPSSGEFTCTDLKRNSTVWHRTPPVTMSQLPKGLYSQTWTRKKKPLEQERAPKAVKYKEKYKANMAGPTSFAALFIVVVISSDFLKIRIQQRPQWDRSWVVHEPLSVIRRDKINYTCIEAAPQPTVYSVRLDWRWCWSTAMDANSDMHYSVLRLIPLRRYRISSDTGRVRQI